MTLGKDDSLMISKPEWNVLAFHKDGRILISNGVSLNVYELRLRS